MATTTTNTIYHPARVILPDSTHYGDILWEDADRIILDEGLEVNTYEFPIIDVEEGRSRYSMPEKVRLLFGDLDKLQIPLAEKYQSIFETKWTDSELDTIAWLDEHGIDEIEKRIFG